MLNSLRNQVSQAGWIGRQRTRHCTSWELHPPPRPNFGSQDPARIGLERRARVREARESATRHPFGPRLSLSLQTFLNVFRNR